LEIEGFFPSFNSLVFLNKYKNNKISDMEFDIFLKQISYSRYLKEKKIDSQLITNQYITNLVRSFKK
jgi:protein involved in sex pheromone biosynthesis